MKALFITTRTNETTKHHESFKSLGHEVALFYYQPKTPTINGKIRQLEHEIYEAAKNYKPDLIVYIGACHPSTPKASWFKRVKEDIAPTVHFCSDAADDPWWPLLEAYDKAGSFTLQVALDGSDEWPLAHTQLTALTVLDQTLYPEFPVSHEQRTVNIGFAGGVGGTRSNKLNALRGLGIKIYQRDNREDSYQKYVDHVLKCRMMVNFAGTGSGRHMHVKGRVLECALAGTMLIEEVGSPTSQWFTPGIDYVEYRTIHDINSVVDYFKTRPLESQIIADNMRAKALKNHNPKAFWDRILERL